jgi:hypothetical protein
MTEERQQGSLDLLAATTLSTRAIVLGKWLGTFRLAVLLAVGPGLIALAMATAREASPMTPPLGWPPEFCREIPLGPRIFGVFVAIGTILAHGALLTSIGLALAVWIKRQSRAIAFSVGLFILIAVAWPIFVGITIGGPGNFGRDLMSLSPIMVCGNLVNCFTMRRYGYAFGSLWWSCLWAAEVLVLALGLLWLTVRTFDHCCDRIPEAARRISVLTVLVIILAGLIGAGSTVGAVAIRFEGILPRDTDTATIVGALAYSLLLAIGLALIVAVSSTSISARRPGESASLEAASVRTVPRFLLDRWWGSFRLVLLLTIGPAVLGLDLATTHKVIPPVAKVTKSPTGAQVVTWEQPDPATANVERVGEVGLAHRLTGVAVWIATILAHGAAAVSIGLALGTAIAPPKRAIIASVAVMIVIVVPLPLYSLVNFLIGNPAVDPGVAQWNFIVAAGSLLAPLLTRIDPNFGQVLATAMLWDTIITLFAAGLFLGTIWMGLRLSLGRSPHPSALRTAGAGKQPAVESALAGD